MGFENGKLVGVRLRASSSTGLENVSVLHYDLDDGDVIDADNGPQGLADAFRDDVVPTWKIMVPESWTIDPVVVYQEKDPLNPTAARGEWVSGSPTAGTRSSSSQLLPFGCSALATLRTPHIGKRFRGRIFLPLPLQEADQNANTIETASATALQAILDDIPVEPDLAFGGSGSSAKWCVYSRTQRAADLDPYASPVVSVQLRTSVHFLRSRSS